MAMTIAQAEKEASSSLWALNNSGGGGKQKGIINIVVRESSGQVNTIRIPVTNIPVDLTTQATKLAILSNPQFRRLIQGNMVQLVSMEDADRLLSTPAAQEEQKRLFSLGYDDLPDIQPDAPTDVQDALNAAGGNIGGYALNLAHNNDGNEDELVANLRINADTLSVDELKYIVNNSVFAKVKTEAAKYIIK